MAEKSTQTQLDDARFKLHEFESMQSYKIRDIFVPEGGDDDDDDDGVMLVAIHAPDGVVFGPNTEVVFINRKTGP